MGTTHVPIVQRILNANDQIAAQNRAKLDSEGIFGINIMASPGAGKTSTILKTIEALKDRMRIGVIEGDTAAVTIDADKIKAVGIPVVQINTGGGCHLDAPMVADALQQLPLQELDLLIVENVGNLVCPATFNIGTHANIVVASIPEGDDKPYKYPRIYQGIDVLLLNKTDLAPYVAFNTDYFRRGVEILNQNVNFLPISCKTGEGLHRWADWLLQKAAH